MAEGIVKWVYRGILSLGFKPKNVGGIRKWMWYREGYYGMCQEIVEFFVRYGL